MTPKETNGACWQLRGLTTAKRNGLIVAACIGTCNWEGHCQVTRWGSKKVTNHGKNGQWLDLVDAARLQSFAANLNNIDWVVVALCTR